MWGQVKPILDSVSELRIIPTRVGTSKNFKNQPNGLYLNVVLSKIKESAVITESHTDYSEASTPLVADSIISLSQLFANVNHSDKRFIKYVPDNFLSTEQIEAKREAQMIDHPHACGDKFIMRSPRYIR